MFNFGVQSEKPNAITTSGKTRPEQHAPKQTFTGVNLKTRCR